MKSIKILVLFAIAMILGSCNTSNGSISQSKKEAKMTLTNKEKAIAIYKAFETGDSKVLDYISDQQYKQHNLAFPEGKEAIKGFFSDKPTGIKVKIHRIFEDNDLVFLHSTLGGVWNNGQPQVAMDVFRFENGLVVEHWDNITNETPPNPSGRTLVDGDTKIADKDQTTANKALAKGLIADVLMDGKGEMFPVYVNPNKYLQHNPQIADGLEAVGAVVKYFMENGIVMEYSQIHKVIGEGNFALVMSEGKFGENGGIPMAYYDLFRIEDGQIVEHWDIMEPIPAKADWKNPNGKF